MEQATAQQRLFKGGSFSVFNSPSSGGLGLGNQQVPPGPSSTVPKPGPLLYTQNEGKWAEVEGLLVHCVKGRLAGS